jgi:hypothetical protein
MRIRIPGAAGVALALAAGGCGDPARDDLGAGDRDAARDPSRGDGGAFDADAVDGAAPPRDAEPPDAERSRDAEPPDAEQPDPGGPRDEHVHILIDNFCNTSASPQSFTVAAGQSLRLTYHNHSIDYDADVWLSYGGGYLGLVTGGSWADSFEHCAGPSSYTAYADISIAGGGGSACPRFRLLIHCQ